MEPLIQRAREKKLDNHDIWSESPYFQHKVLFEAFIRLKYVPGSPSTSELTKLEVHLNRALDRETSLVAKVLIANSLDIIIILLLGVVNTCLCELTSFSRTNHLTEIVSTAYASPYFLKRILESLTSGDPSSSLLSTPATLYAILTLFCSVLASVLDLVYMWYLRRGYERMRGELICLLHWKALKRIDMRGVLEKKEEDAEDGDGDGDNTAGAGKGKKKESMFGWMSDDKNLDDVKSASIGKLVNMMRFVRIYHSTTLLPEFDH